MFGFFPHHQSFVCMTVKRLHRRNLRDNVTMCVLGEDPICGDISHCLICTDYVVNYDRQTLNEFVLFDNFP